MDTEKNTKGHDTPIYTSDTVHQGDMRCHTVFTTCEGEAMTDIPQALGGIGEYPAPAQMLAACVASCMLSMIAYTGRNKGFETNGIGIRAAAVERNNGISALLFDIHVPVPTTPEARRYMKGAVASCPVGRSISEDIRKEIHWNWSDED